VQEKAGQITLRVSESVYAKWRRLGRGWKHFIRDLLEVLVEAAGETLEPPALQVHTSIEVCTEARELLEKLRKAGEAVLCVARTLQVCEKHCSKACVESIKTCTKRYWE